MKLLVDACVAASAKIALAHAGHDAESVTDWPRDPKELYYINPAPIVLFPTRIFGGGVDAQQGRQYDVAADGRFLINAVLDSAAAPITLLQNWHPEAKK